jgi:hypothetical protein
MNLKYMNVMLIVGMTTAELAELINRDRLELTLQ